MGYRQLKKSHIAHELIHVKCETDRSGRPRAGAAVKARPRVGSLLGAVDAFLARGFVHRVLRRLRQVAAEVAVVLVRPQGRLDRPRCAHLTFGRYHAITSFEMS